MLLVLFFFLNAHKSFSGEEVKIYYLPFYVDTYLAVSNEDMRDAAICELAVLNDSDYMGRINHIITAGEKSQYYEGLVRVEILRSNGTSVYIDQGGVTFDTEGAKSKKLSGDAFIELKSIIEKSFDNIRCRNNMREKWGIK